MAFCENSRRRAKSYFLSTRIGNCGQLVHCLRLLAWLIKPRRIARYWLATMVRGVPLTKVRPTDNFRRNFQFFIEKPKRKENRTKEEGKTYRRVQGEPGQMGLSPSNTNWVIRPWVLLPPTCEEKGTHPKPQKVKPKLRTESRVPQPKRGRLFLL